MDHGIISPHQDSYHHRTIPQWYRCRRQVSKDEDDRQKIVQICSLPQLAGVPAYRPPVGNMLVGNMLVYPNNCQETLLSQFHYLPSCQVVTYELSVECPELPSHSRLEVCKNTKRLLVDRRFQIQILRERPVLLVKLNCYGRAGTWKNLHFYGLYIELPKQQQKRCKNYCYQSVFCQ